MAHSFLTISIDLVEHAEKFAAYLKNDGYKISAEPKDISYPVSPTLLGTKGSAAYFVEVSDSCKINKIVDWVSYTKCRQQETYFSLVVPSTARISTPNLAKLRELGVGLYYSDGDIREIIRPSDLAMNINLPPLTGKPAGLKKAIKPIYDKFNRGDWPDGFKDACQLLESKARKYLVSEIKKGGKSFVRNGVPRTISVADANRMTLGQLAVAFGQIVYPTAEENAIKNALSAVNPDRIGAVHNTNDAKVKRKLRKNVGKHLWVLLNGLTPLF